MKILTSDREWALWVFAGTPLHMRFVIEPADPTRMNAALGTRQYAFIDDAVDALVLKGYAKDESQALVQEAVTAFKRGDGEPLLDT